MVVVITIIVLWVQNPLYKELNPVHKYLANNVVDKWEAKILTIDADRRAIVDYDTLFAELNFFERRLVKKVFDINPADLGFRGKFFSLEKPNNLKLIESVTLIDKDGEEYKTGIQYAPPHVYIDFVKMNKQMQSDIGKKLFIDSGYRSQGRQAYLFFFYLVRSNNYSLSENAKWIAMPGYSEHGNPIRTSLDLVNENGINGFNKGQTAADFENLKEYEWLLRNASTFNFYISYPKENEKGVVFEPWHWHWNGPDSLVNQTKLSGVSIN